MPNLLPDTDDYMFPKEYILCFVDTNLHPLHDGYYYMFPEEYVLCVVDTGRHPLPVGHKYMFPEDYVLCVVYTMRHPLQKWEELMVWIECGSGWSWSIV